ncbi:hypothetical protein SAMN05216228_10022 [Rhizobium tibeticum]|uniref:Uncharacterized protein n=1 Tax=Rhizobium tibeticum TaxID=501024 RepID=A0A1H8DC45_9HYPH|nr:hypothetical protein [Rhizobium tibeticum]SEH51261.1 hypothetical protein RTCCBAU85039_0823 [Rhizobium tibeticum]SEN04840.1 hypothetical protein SAMN05216228_10022 [Rhizobium tibeticum]
MSLLNLLSLDDDGIDCVTSVVRKWCEQHGVELDSQRGHEAMATAIQLVTAGEKSPEIVADALSRHLAAVQDTDLRTLN